VGRASKAGVKGKPLSPSEGIFYSERGGGKRETRGETEAKGRRGNNWKTDVRVYQDKKKKKKKGGGIEARF